MAPKPKPMISQSAFKALVKDVKDTNERVKRMETALMGDEEMEVEGIVGKVASHGKYIARDKKIKYIIGGAMAGGNIGWWTYIKQFLGV